MRIYSSCNPKPRTDLDGISNKNSLRNRLVKSAYKVAKSVIETSSKVQEPKTYNKAINNPIYRRWRKVINKKLLNLDIYQTWNYT